MAQLWGAGGRRNLMEGILGVGAVRRHRGEPWAGAVKSGERLRGTIVG